MGLFKDFIYSFLPAVRILVTENISGWLCRIMPISEIFWGNHLKSFLLSV